MAVTYTLVGDQPIKASELNRNFADLDSAIDEVANTDLQAVDDRVTELEDHKTGSSSFFATSITNKTLANADADILFDVITTNLGSDYNSTNGVYTAPDTGVYFFTWSGVVETDNGSAHIANFFFEVNDNTQYFAGRIEQANPTYNGKATASGSIVLSLTSGDTVKIVGNCEGTITDGKLKYRSFSGALLHKT